MKQVHVATDPIEAAIVEGLLAASGIEATVIGGTVYSLRGELPMTSDTLPTVWILDDRDLERARSIVEEDRRRRTLGATDAAAWRCPGCGETLESQFTDCWQCGTPRSDRR